MPLWQVLLLTQSKLSVPTETKVSDAILAEFERRLDAGRRIVVQPIAQV